MSDNLLNGIYAQMQELSHTDIDQLYETIGQQMSTIQANAYEARLEQIGDKNKVTNVQTTLSATDLKRLGRNFVQRVNLNAYELICNSDTNDPSHKYLEFLRIDEVKAASFMGAILMGPPFGIAPVYALPAAWIITKLLIMPAVEVSCDAWAAIVSKEN